MTASGRWDERERLMLVAAIGEPAAAEAAYERWRAEVDLTELGGAAIRVLPLLADRARATDDHTVTRQVAKVVRFSWLKSQLLVTRILPSLVALQEAGIPVMLTKGAAVVQHTHGRLHLRPMNDLDVAVPRGRAGRAARLLLDRGLRAADLPARPRGAAILDQVHAVAFTDPETQAELDLHWQVIHGSLHRSASKEFWARARDGELRGMPVKVLAPEDTLVQVIAHGERWNLDRPLVWATDAALLLRDRPETDWELVADVAARHRVAGVVAEGLAGLRDLAPGLVPQQLPGPLRGPRIGGRPRPGSGRTHWQEFVRRTVAPGRRPGAPAALAYAREAFAFERVSELPALVRWWAGRRRRRLAHPVGTLGPEALRPDDEIGFTALGNGAAPGRPGLVGPGPLRTLVEGARVRADRAAVRRARADGETGDRAGPDGRRSGAGAAGCRASRRVAPGDVEVPRLAGGEPGPRGAGARRRRPGPPPLRRGCPSLAGRGGCRRRPPPGGVRPAHPGRDAQGHARLTRTGQVGLPFQLSQSAA